MYMRSDQPETLGVHLGFREYLYDPSPNSSFMNVNEQLSTKVRTLIGLHNNQQQQQSASSSATCEGASSTNDGNNIDAHESSPSNDTSSPSSPSPQCRLDKILDEIEILRRANQDFRIYVSGHSLGELLYFLIVLPTTDVWIFALKDTVHIAGTASNFTFSLICHFLQSDPCLVI